MAPRRDVSAERKTQILDAALRVFARKGFYEARMEDIAREAGLSKGLLYWYFGSKEALIETLLILLFEPDLRDLERLLREPHRPTPERLQELAQNALSTLLPYQDLMPIVYEFYALATRPGPVKKAVQQYYRRYRELLSELLAQGIARHELRPDLDPSQTALALLAQFEGLILLWVIGPDHVDIERHWHAITQQSLACLLPEPEPYP
ncbi:MAG: TetR/AcrR family transcriptional regulator [Chloroflexi bacterium]|nr:TetR/AcrR family transcriptional regulator [Chloroflexota bacterium]